MVGPQKCNTRVQLDYAIARVGEVFTFIDVFNNANMPSSAKAHARRIFDNMAQKGDVKRVDRSTPAKYKKSTATLAMEPSSSVLYELLVDAPHLTPPVRVDALDFLACPSLMNGKLIPRRRPISGMVTEVSATSRSGIDARRLMF